MAVTKLNAAARAEVRRLNIETRKTLQLEMKTRKLSLDPVSVRFVPVPGGQGIQGIQGIQGTAGLNGDGNIDGFAVAVTAPAQGEAIIFRAVDQTFINAQPLEIFDGGNF